MAARKLVHIVDDEHAIRRSTSFMLQTAGYAVRTWPTGAAFLKEVRQAPEGCVLLDIRMPDMDGIAVQQRLVAGGIAIPVLVLTGHADVSTIGRASCRERGCTDVWMSVVAGSLKKQKKL